MDGALLSAQATLGGLVTSASKDSLSGKVPATSSVEAEASSSVGMSEVVADLETVGQPMEVPSSAEEPAAWKKPLPGHFTAIRQRK